MNMKKIVIAIANSKKEFPFSFEAQKCFNILSSSCFTSTNMLKLSWILKNIVFHKLKKKKKKKEGTKKEEKTLL